MRAAMSNSERFSLATVVKAVQGEIELCIDRSTRALGRGNDE
jgi:hypothetical protein